MENEHEENGGLAAGTVEGLCVRAHDVATALRASSGALRNRAVAQMSQSLKAAREVIMAANAADMEAGRERGLSKPMLKRLEISEKVFGYMQTRLETVAALPDPVGRVLNGHTQPDGLRVQRVSVPIGVIGIIYESRPNVTTDAASVCLKSGNAVVLRGGSESLRTNAALTDAMRAAVAEAGLPADCVQMIPFAGHEAVGEMLKMDRYIDLLIPRGGRPLIERIAQGTRIPVLKHYEGICHLYAAEDAPQQMAIELIVNSKCQRVEVCNALETVLVDEAVAESLLPALAAALAAEGVSLRVCERALTILECAGTTADVSLAAVVDWDTEYLAPILAVRVVPGIESAIDHIQTHGSGHTDGIITQRQDLAEQFTREVDSASVLVNASTRLSGGGDYGLGAVVGISTDRLHARGPVGPAELTTYKWIAIGHGHLRI